MSDKKISQLTASTTPLAGTEELPIVQSGATKKTSIESVLTSVQPSGTANGVTYLNGSKVLTSGSSLTFDGTNLGIGTSSPEDKINIINGNLRFTAPLGGTGTYGTILSYNTAAPAAPATAIRFIRDQAVYGNDGAILFDTLNTERARINSAGYLIVPAGITLGTTAGTYNADNTLDDYEEGTWTPVFGSWTVNPTVATTAKYTKIGSLVYISVYLTGGTTVPGCEISGLPFTVGTEASCIATNGSTSNVALTGTLFSGNTKIGAISGSTVLTGTYYAVSATYII
jgi:hypothetical protein